MLGQELVLAYILVKTVDEFCGMNPKEVVPYIIGKPLISSVPVEAGLTNAANVTIGGVPVESGLTDAVKTTTSGVTVKLGLTDAGKERAGQRIIGFNTEYSEINEGLVRFDIVFYVQMKDGISQMIINIEAQKGESSDYKILNRAIYYLCRLVSSQKERDFTHSHYDDVKRVYSIWVCMNRKENSINHFHLTDEQVLGDCRWKGKLDLLNIVLIGLSDELPEHEEQYELNRLLGALLSRTLTAEERLEIVGNEYDIPIEEVREDVSVMCNLSQGLVDEGIAKGIAIGKVENEAKVRRMIFNMRDQGFTLEQIVAVTDKTLEEVEEILAGKETTEI